MDLVAQLISFFKKWSRFFGLTNKQNFEDQFYQLLREKNYDEAIKLAQQYKYLDIDLVHKCRWRNSGITVQSITNVLASIEDKLWAINECVQTVPISYETCRTLLEFGLQEASLKLLYQLGKEESTGPLKSSKIRKKDQTASQQPTTEQPRFSSRLSFRNRHDPVIDDDLSEEEYEGLIDFGNLNDQQKELCRCRQDLLRHQFSLLAYENILGDQRAAQQYFDHVFYDEFRQKCPFDACIDYANNGDPHAVEVLLNFYTQDTAKHILAILSNFPETTSPYQYRNLLPCLREGECTYDWRPTWTPNIEVKHPDEYDWSNRAESISMLLTSLKSDAETFEREFYKSNESLKKYLDPLNSELLSEWYLSRALEMELRTSLLTCAIQLLKLGIELNINNLKPTLEELLEFDYILYECDSDTTLYLGFQDFKKMSKIERLVLSTGGDWWEACQIIMKKNYTDCWELCYQLGMQKEFKNCEAKYKLLAFALAHCDDHDGKMSAKILQYVIDLRKRDENIQLAYLKLHI